MTERDRVVLDGKAKLFGPPEYIFPEHLLVHFKYLNDARVGKKSFPGIHMGQQGALIRDQPARVNPRHLHSQDSLEISVEWNLFIKSKRKEY
nr:hypothetical protein [Candidatus Sigynarchaeota archaeon]